MPASSEAPSTPMDDDGVVALFDSFAAAEPHPRGELDHRDPFTLLVAVVLSAQSTDKGVNKVTPELFGVAPTAQAMVELGEDGVRERITSLGLYRNKARNLAALARMLVERHQGEVPNDQAALEALPGVGSKTARVVMNAAFGAPTIAVDTHVRRVANRLGLARGDVAEVERALDARVPPERKLYAHHWLVLHGRYVCKARAPKCAECIVRTHCGWQGKS